MKTYKLRMDVQSPPTEKLDFINRILSLISPELFYLYFSSTCSRTPPFCIGCSSSCENMILFVMFRKPQLLFHTNIFSVHEEFFMSEKNLFKGLVHAYPVHSVTAHLFYLVVVFCITLKSDHVF